ncbi:hypothetical protein TL16_g02174 [Triparma laevis f. inornata]|uniref:Uncharacterized protein n=1 Tax=Triparma laevis f. inornata TaxID=1714386 RepID=A0A9W7DZN2_9STRA|nr:hypothetical protein TL16_g02174 [Triparma laevis f. inornata]
MFRAPTVTSLGVSSPLATGEMKDEAEDSPSIPSSTSSTSSALSTPTTPPPLPIALYSFTRPHTFIGTFLTIPSLFLTLAPTLTFTNNYPLLAKALVPALLSNAYITGLNQITDVKIDTINKSWLPIPSGEITLRTAKIFTCFTFVFSTLASLTNKYLFATVLSCNVIGTLYSLKPFRLKERSPWLALACISLVRGAIINCGFSLAFASMLGVGVGWKRVASISTYFTLFGAVISLMKDVPDTKGDDYRTFAKDDKLKAYGNARLLTLLNVGIPSALFFAIGLWTKDTFPGVRRFGVGVVGAAMTRWFFQKSENDTIEKVEDVYMDCWKLFYVSYLVLPWAW